LVNSGLSLTEPSGQAYVARLGMRVQGTELHAQGINSLATWHPQLGAVQAAQGELLLRQGNASGARARFMLALKLDPQLWPLQRYLQQIDALKQPTISMPAAAKVA
jgi:predicted negative regulator of RcsB-dependent stress response